MSGGLVVGQSGGVTPVINASLAGVIAAATRHGPVYGMRHGVRGLLDGDIARLDGLGDTALARLRATPGAWLGSCRYAPDDDELERILDRLRALDVRRYVYIGGNDSAATNARLAQAAVRRGQELAVVSVPKTIDNDLPEMDHTPGYPTAAAYVALATKLLLLDTRAMCREEPVRVIEVKGRHSGWLAAACAAFVEPAPAGSGGPLTVCLPERPLEPERLLAAVDGSLSRYGYALVAVSEHAAGPGGAALGENGGYSDAFGHGDSAAPGAYLRGLIERELHRRCRLEVLGALQKVALLPGGNTLDRDEAFAAGEQAVHAALAGETDVCVTINRVPCAAYRAVFGLTPLARVAATERLLPESFLDGNGPSAAFRTWLQPLVAEAAALAADLFDEAWEMAPR